jgi:hypothetical protein
MSGRPPVSYRSTLTVASLAAVFLWYLPAARWALSPITFINTFIHEYCHAIAAWVTGGSVGQIVIENNAAGATLTGGGNEWIISSAGYVGSAIVGAILLRLAHRDRLMRVALTGAAIVLLAGMVAVVRGHMLGVGIGVVSAVALLIAARLLPSAGVVFLAQFLAIQQCAASFQAFYWLFVATNVGNGTNDAAAMAALTHVPAVFWASLWSLFSAVLIYFALRGAWRETGRVRPRRTPPSGDEPL